MKIWSGFTFLSIVILGIYSCQKDTVDVQLDSTPYVLDFGDFPPPMIAPDNPLTVQGVKLGRMLFYETRLSKDNSMSCASCHRQEHAFTDMRDQSLLPIQDPLEMNETLENVVAKLSADQNYRDQFIRTFGNNEITSEKISLALEQFMNSIVSVESKYDRWLRGEVTLTASENRGRKLYFQEFNPFFPDSSGADCAHCHGGPNFENDQYMNNGLDADGNIQDNGREEATGLAQDKGKFKVVSLRNIELTAPYMHDGRFNTLEEVVDHYNTGIELSTTLDPALHQVYQEGGLALNDQNKQDLVAFLKTLTDEVLMTDPRYSDPN
jgi:cytochrome c peroxidase